MHPRVLLSLCSCKVITGTSIQIHAVGTGQVKWRLEYRHVASPVARLLLSESDGTCGVFALFGKVGHSPRVYASRDRDALLKQLQTAAYKKMGLTLAGIAHSAHIAHEHWFHG